MATEAYNRISPDDKKGDILSDLPPTIGQSNEWELSGGRPIECDDPKAVIKQVANGLARAWKERLGDPPSGETYYLGKSGDSPMIFVEKDDGGSIIERVQFYVHFSSRNKSITAYNRGAYYWEKRKKIPARVHLALILLIAAVAYFSGSIWAYLIGFTYLLFAYIFWSREPNFIKLSPNDATAANPRNLSESEVIATPGGDREKKLQPWVEENLNDLERAVDLVLSSLPLGDGGHGVERRDFPSID